MKLSTVPLVALLCIVLASCATTTTVKGPDLQVPIVSYIRTWPLGSTTEDMKAGVHWTAATVKGEFLSQINIAFALIKDGTDIYLKDIEDQENEDGTITKGFADLWEQIAELQNKYPDLRINLSIGGWGAEGFSDLASTAETRQAFVDNVVSWIEKYNLDGADIDWEYPVGPDWGQEIKSRPEDKENYLLLLKDLRAGMDELGQTTGKSYNLSTAVPASPWFVEKIDVAAVSQVVDYMKLMAYDYYGGWSETTGHASNLYNNPADPAWGGWSSDQAVQIFLAADVPASKLLLGVPFYGRAWKGVPADQDGLFQKYEASEFPDGLSWTDLKSSFIDKNGYVRYWDDVAKAPYLYNGDIWITYEDEEALKYKAEYVKEYGLAGIMIWEYGHDADADLLATLNSYLEK